MEDYTMQQLIQASKSNAEAMQAKNAISSAMITAYHNDEQESIKI